MPRDLSVVSLWGANGPVNKAAHCIASVKRRVHTAQYSTIGRSLKSVSREKIKR